MKTVVLVGQFAAKWRFVLVVSVCLIVQLVWKTARGSVSILKQIDCTVELVIVPVHRAKSVLVVSV